MSSPFRHEALLYAGLDQFVARVAAFARDGVRAEEPTLVVVGREKLDRLREALDDDADGVLFADMADVGANPARIIPAWREFVSAHAGPGRPLRGVGEPIYPERGAAELVECHRHEALLNVAFADTPGFWLVCPYDTEALDPEVVETARRTHPAVIDGSITRTSATFDGLDAIAAPFGDPLPEPPPDADERAVGATAFSELRRYVRAQAALAGLDADRARDLAIAVHEMAANSVRHGGGRGRLLMWEEPETLICEIRDTGRILEPLAGRERPQEAQTGGYGLWLANQLCDLVQVRAFERGGAVRLHMRRA